MRPRPSSPGMSGAAYHETYPRPALKNLIVFQTNLAEIWEKRLIFFSNENQSVFDSTFGISLNFGLGIFAGPIPVYIGLPPLLYSAEDAAVLSVIAQMRISTRATNKLTASQKGPSARLWQFQASPTISAWPKAGLL